MGKTVHSTNLPIVCFLVNIVKELLHCPILANNQKFVNAFPININLSNMTKQD